jgi:hypothetical protein
LRNGLGGVSTNRHLAFEHTERFAGSHGLLLPKARYQVGSRVTASLDGLLEPPKHEQC